MTPCRRVYVDTIGPWEIYITEYKKGKRGQRKKIINKLVTINSMTMLDEATSCSEIIIINDETMHESARALDK